MSHWYGVRELAFKMAKQSHCAFLVFYVCFSLELVFTAQFYMKVSGKVKTVIHQLIFPYFKNLLITLFGGIGGIQILIYPCVVIFSWCE